MTESNAVIPSSAQIKTQARAKAREVLSKSTSYPGLPVEDQKSIYLSLVQEYIDKK